VTESVLPPTLEYASPQTPAADYRRANARRLLLTAVVVFGLLLPFSFGRRNREYDLIQRLGDTWPERIVNHGTYTSRHERFTWLLPAVPVFSPCVVIIAMVMGGGMVSRRRPPVLLGVFVAAVFISALLFALVFLRLPLFWRAGPFSLVPMLVGSVGAAVECHVRRLERRWMVASFLAIGCTFSAYAAMAMLGKIIGI
jgi:hypothetical protein